MNHCCHNCLGAFSAELKLLSLNFLWSMDHSFSKQTRNDSSSDSRLEGLTACYDTAFFFTPAPAVDEQRQRRYDSRKKVSGDIRLGWRPQGRCEAGHV